MFVTAPERVETKSATAAHHTFAMRRAQSSIARHTPRVNKTPQPASNPVWQRLALQGQTKAAISVPTDAYELEADHVAEEVMNEPANASINGLPHIDGNGGRLPEASRAFFETRFGHDFSRVRLHAGGDAGEAAQSVNARAFTIGPDIFFGRGQFAPETDEGQRLLAHELAHVVQQRSAPEIGASNRRAADRAPVEVSQSAAPGGVIHRRPAELIDDFNFLGNRVGGGINATLRDRLIQVEARLQQVYDAIDPNHPDRVHFGGAPKTLHDWSGVTSIRGWRPGSNTSKHSSGSAVDINYDLQPYIATRTQVGDRTVYGGEAAGAHLQAERRAATEVYDRAVQFVFNAGAADVSARRPGETTSAVYQRFRQTDMALSYYLRHAFLEDPTAVTRPPIQNIEAASEADLLATIPLTERRAEAEAISMLEHYMDEDFRRAHPNWTLSPRETYFRMLRDYEHVRIPMVRGKPEARPANTRNPTRGFLHLRREVVEALVDVGRLRWGAADLGETESGDVHHFDLGNHGGVTPDGAE
jgi:hypothetical protein